MHPGDAVDEVPGYSGTGRPKKPGYRTTPMQAEVLACSLPIKQYRQVAWWQGSKGAPARRLVATRVRPANRNLPRCPDGALPACWLLVEWLSAADAVGQDPVAVERLATDPKVRQAEWVSNSYSPNSRSRLSTCWRVVRVADAPQSSKHY